MAHCGLPPGSYVAWLGHVLPGYAASQPSLLIGHDTCIGKCWQDTVKYA